MGFHEVYYEEVGLLQFYFFQLLNYRGGAFVEGWGWFVYLGDVFGDVYSYVFGGGFYEGFGFPLPYEGGGGFWGVSVVLCEGVEDYCGGFPSESVAGWVEVSAV